MAEILIDLHLKKTIHTTEGIEVLDIQLQVPEFQLITLFGKSGVGKTTLLRMIAGLSKPDSGYIRVGKEIWYDNRLKINIKPQQRNIGFVFQDYALFPNMTVKDHLLYANSSNESKYVSELLDIFHLKGLCKRKPGKLSGGQQQRLAVARALARKPKILIMDEPLSALDTETRMALQQEILLAHKNFNATTLLVSHDVYEVLTLSDYVYVIENGTITQHGCPEKVLSIPNKVLQGKFIGKVIKIQGDTLTVKVNGIISTIKVNPSELELLSLHDTVLMSNSPA